MNYRMILYTIGCVLNIEAATIIFPIICSLVYSDGMLPEFAITMVLCLIFGISFSLKPPKNKILYAKEGFVIVAVSWFIISIFGALPFVISHYIPNFIDALFETVSGFTTTGASILSDVEALPKSLLFWRSFTHWIGGMGVLVFLVAIVPLSGGNNQYLLKAESTGPAVSKLVPKVGSTAKLLYIMYISMTLILIGLLKIGGLGWFESLTLSFGTAGTGGFGIVNSSIADYSPYIQYVLAIFMILFGVDFMIYYLIILRKFKLAIKSEEVRTYLGIIVVSTLVIATVCLRNFGNDFTESFRHSLFQVASLITTTGFSTLNYEIWPQLAKTILLLVMFIGACAGSTGGGIKVSRILIMLKTIKKEISTAVHPKRISKITMNGNLVQHETVRAINVFMMAYLVIFVFSILVISLDNMDFLTNFTAVAATLNNIGPGFGVVGPAGNFGGFSVLSKIVFIFDMVIGRLEVFPVLILFSLSTWKK